MLVHVVNDDNCHHRVTISQISIHTLIRSIQRQNQNFNVFSNNMHIIKKEKENDLQFDKQIDNHGLDSNVL